MRKHISVLAMLVALVALSGCSTSSTQKKSNRIYITDDTPEHASIIAEVNRIMASMDEDNTAGDDAAGHELEQEQDPTLEIPEGKEEKTTAMATTASQKEEPLTYDTVWEFLNRKPGKWGDLDWCEYYAFTFGDPPEDQQMEGFIIKAGNCESDTKYIVYYADDQDVYLMGSFGTGHSVLYTDPATGELYRVYGQMGYGATYRVMFDEKGDLVETAVIPEHECDDYNELVDPGWKLLEGTILRQLLA